MPRSPLPLPIYAAVALLGFVLVYVPFYLPSWLVPAEGDLLLEVNELLEPDGVQAETLEEAAELLGQPPEGEWKRILAEHVGAKRAERSLFAEDGLYETAQAILLGAALLILLWTYIRIDWPSRLGRFVTQRNLFVLALAGMLFVMLGEEVSWGQRLLKFGTPEWLTRRNFQGEFTFHNLWMFQTAEQGNRLEVGWMWLVVFYVGIIPWIVSFWSPAGAFVKRVGLPVASWPLAAVLLLLFVVSIVSFLTSEVTELLFDVVLLVWALELFREHSTNLPQGEKQWLAYACGLWATLWLLSLPFQGGDADLPSVRSTDQFKRGQRLRTAGELDEAQAAFEQALSIWPNNLQAHHELGLLLIVREQPSAAEEHFLEALRIEPRYLPTIVSLATLLADQERWEEAIAYYRQALDVAPDLEQQLNTRDELLQAANNIAWIMATQQNEALRNPETALELAELLCEATNNEDPNHVDTLAAACAANGDFDRAIELAELAIERAIEVDEIALAGRIQRRLNLYNEGQMYYEQPLP